MAIRLGKWRLEGGIEYPKKGHFSRQSLAEKLRLYRKLARGKLTAQEKKILGPAAKPKDRLAGRAGATAWNEFARSGYRAWQTRRAKYGPSGRGKKGSLKRKKR
jgi:hypothetical protein